MINRQLSFNKVDKLSNAPRVRSGVLEFRKTPELAQRVYVKLAGNQLFHFFSFSTPIFTLAIYVIFKIAIVKIYLLSRIHNIAAALHSG